MDLHHGGDYQSEITLVDPTQSPNEGDEAHLTHQILHDSNANTTTTTTTTTPTESHLINHHHHHLIALQEEEVVYGHPQGSRGGRLYKKSNWVVEEMLVLQAAKREDLHRKGSSSASQQAQERWNWIEDFCWASGVQRSAQQCHDKWEVISTAYKKVYNNEKYVCSGQKSYWNMSPEERKRNKLPPNFQKEIFTALLEWCNNKIRNSDSGELVVDTSGPLGPSGVKAELLDSEEESGEETSGPNQSGGKKRKLWSKGDEGALASILVRNNKNVVEAMLESEDRKDKRHREDLEMERVKLELEKEKFRGAMRLGSGYIEALVNIGDGLKQLSAALCSNIHS